MTIPGIQHAFPTVATRSTSPPGQLARRGPGGRAACPIPQVRPGRLPRGWKDRK